MTPREQFSWAWLTILGLTYIPYFSAVAWLREFGAPSFTTQIILFAATTIIQVGCIAVASAVIGLRAGDPNILDERDRAIAHRAGAVAYTVLMVGVILVGCLMPFNHAGWDIFHATVLVIAATEAVRLILVIQAYRRGLHG